MGWEFERENPDFSVLRLSGSEVVKRRESGGDELTLSMNQSQAWLAFNHPDSRHGCLAARGCGLNRLAGRWWGCEGQFVVVTTRKSHLELFLGVKNSF